MDCAEGPLMMETGLKRIAALSANDKTKKFRQLMHHFNVEELRACYHELDGKKAKGIDGVDKSQYGEELDKHLGDLIERMKRMAYKPGAVRQVLIPKEGGKPGATRPLGISNFEDKIIQKMMQKILESIYEPLFWNNSYGFRPNRGCHDALKTLQNYLASHEVETVIDVDLSNFFGSIDHELLLGIIGRKIEDQKFIRYLKRMFKAGVLSDGELTVSEEGVPQGSVCSPILANIFAHEVIDTWIEETVKPLCEGEVKMVRYADDIVICCRYNKDAQRIKKALGQRLAKYKLKMNEEKTKLVKFSRLRLSRGEDQETFDFLGFTLYLGKTRAGKITTKLKTKGKSFRTKLKKVNEWAKKAKNKYPMAQLMKTAKAKLSGHIQYYGVSHNYDGVRQFAWEVQWILFKWLNRRSQRKSMTWKEFETYLTKNQFPKGKIHYRLF